METYADAVKRFLEQRRQRDNSYTQNELARRAGYSTSFIAAMLKGACLPDYDGVERISRALGLSDRDDQYCKSLAARQKADANPLVREMVEHMELQVKEAEGSYNTIPLTVPAQRVPVFEINAGTELSYDDGGYPVGVADDYLSIPGLTDPNAFGCFVRGDSMVPELEEGDIAIFSPARRPGSGDIAFVRTTDGRTTLKHVYFETAPGGAKHVRLAAANRHYPDERLPIANIVHICPMYAKLKYRRESA